MGNSVNSLQDRFDAKWTPEPFSGCHLWTATRSQDGYGRILILANGKVRNASRVSWLLNRGTIPNGLCVLHRCDTPSCVNPSHLFLGDKSANTRDAIEKGRWPDKSGENNIRAKLTAETVLLIRAAKGTTRELARRFSISQPTISSIQNRRTWGQI